MVSNLYRYFDNKVTTILKQKTSWEIILEYKEHGDYFIDVHWFTDCNEFVFTLCRKPHFEYYFEDKKLYSKWKDFEHTQVRSVISEASIRDIMMCNTAYAFFESLATKMYNDYINYDIEKEMTKALANELTQEVNSNILNRLMNDTNVPYMSEEQKQMLI